MFSRRAPVEIKTELEKLKENWKRNLKIGHQRALESDLETHNRHHALIKACAKAFAGTSLSQVTGFQFYFLEPLREKSSEKPNNCIFDLVLYNEVTHAAIFIECKSSSKNCTEGVKQIQYAKKLVLENLDYLSKGLDLDLNPDKLEFVECVFFDDSFEVANAVSSKSQPAEISGPTSVEIKIWEYFPGTEELRLCNGYRHSDQNLTEMLSRRYGGKELSSQFDVPYYLNLHPFLVIVNIVIGYCYRENLIDDDVVDKKIISKDQIFKHLLENAYFGLSDSELKMCLKKLTESVIEYGVKHDLFEILTSGDIKLKCQGTKLKVVIENITKKYCDNWTDFQSEERAKHEALNDIKTKINQEQQTLSDWKF